MGPPIQEENRMKGILLGFAGGSGSGKSKITETLLKNLGIDSAVIRQYEATARPMHIKFVEPSKQYADIIIPVKVSRMQLSIFSGRK